MGVPRVTLRVHGTAEGWDRSKTSLPRVCLSCTPLLHSCCLCTAVLHWVVSIQNNQRRRNLTVSLLKPSMLSSRRGPGSAELSRAEPSWAGQPSSRLQLAPVAEIGTCTLSPLCSPLFPGKSTHSSPPSLPLMVHPYLSTGAVSCASQKPSPLY